MGNIKYENNNLIKNNNIRMPNVYTKIVHNENLSYSYKESLVHKICNLSPFLPKTLDVKIKGENLTIKMEFLQKSLKNPSFENKIKAWLDVLQAVALLNSFGIAHRDIKTDNIMYRDGEQAVLIDFGLSKELIGESHTPDVISRFYRPPELDEELDMQPYGFEIDSWSMGIWALELFLGKNFDYYEFNDDWESIAPKYIEQLPLEIKHIVASFLVKSSERKTALDWVKIENPKALLYYPPDFSIDVPHKVKEWEHGYKCVAWGLKEEYSNITDNELTATALWVTSLLFLPYPYNIHGLANSFKVSYNKINELGLNWFIKWKVSKHND